MCLWLKAYTLKLRTPLIETLNCITDSKLETFTIKIINNWGERSEPLPSQPNVNFVCVYVCIYVYMYVMDRLDISF